MGMGICCGISTEQLHVNLKCAFQCTPKIQAKVKRICLSGTLTFSNRILSLNFPAQHKLICVSPTNRSKPYKMLQLSVKCYVTRPHSKQIIAGIFRYNRHEEHAKHCVDTVCSLTIQSENACGLFGNHGQNDR